MTTCRMTSSSKNRRRAERWTLRVGTATSSASRYLPTCPGITCTSSIPLAVHHSEKMRSACKIGLPRVGIPNLPVKELLERKARRIPGLRDPGRNVGRFPLRQRPWRSRRRQPSLFHTPPCGLSSIVGRFGHLLGLASQPSAEPANARSIHATAGVCQATNSRMGPPPESRPR